MKYLQHNPQWNCDNDLASVLSATENMPHLAQTKTIAQIVNRAQLPRQPLEIDSTDYRNVEIGEQNVLRYICGYLISKCLKKIHVSNMSGLCQRLW
jgi:hypothetical protein